MTPSSVPDIRAVVDQVIPLLERTTYIMRTDAEERDWRARTARLRTFVRSGAARPIPPEVEADLRFFEREAALAFGALHDGRNRDIDEAIAEVKAARGWDRLRPQYHREILRDLEAMRCEREERRDGRCRRCGADLGRLESDIAAIDEAKAKAIAVLDALTTRKPGPGER